MIGTLNDKHPEAVIIGAGFAGLLAAHRLLQRGYRVKIYDASARVGGLIQTTHHEHGLAEAAAHTIRSSPAMDALFAELQVESVTARTNKKTIWRNGAARAFPLSVWESAELAARAAFMPAKPHYETLQDWALHHTGRGALDNIFYPMMNGIYAANAADLSSQLIFPKLVPPAGKTLLQQAMAARSARSRYKTRVMAPRMGMQALTDALFHRAESHPKAQMFLGERVAALPDAPNVIVTVPAHAAGKILGSHFSSSCTVLSGVRYAPMISATVFLERRHHTPPTGIGVLCAARQSHACMGILFNASCFEGRVRDESRMASYTVMLGGTGNPNVLEQSDEAIQTTLAAECAAMLNAAAPPVSSVIHRWPAAIPVYSPELLAAHAVLQADFCAQPGRMLFGNYTGQISLRGMADALPVQEISI